MTRNMKRTMAVVMSLALGASGLVQAQGVSAAAKVKLSATKATIKVGAKKTVTIKGVKKANVKKLTLKSSSKAATVKKNSNVKFTVTGKKAGKATITAKVSLKKAVAKKKSYSLKYVATVKATAITEKTVTKFADLESAIKTVSVAGGKVTINSDESGAFVIDAGDYSNVDLIVNAPNADVENSATFNTITIKAIKASTWTEKGTGNDFTISATTSTRIVAAAGSSISSIVYENSGAGVTNTLEALGAIADISINGGSNVNINASGAGAKIDTIEVNDKDAKVAVAADLTATVSQITVGATATLSFSGDSANQTIIKKVEGATVTNTAPNAIETTISTDPSPAPTATATATASATPTASASATPTTSAAPASTGGPQGGGISSGGSGSSDVGLPKSIIFDANGGTIADTDQRSVKYTEEAGATITAPTAKKDGATCLGWSFSYDATVPSFAQGATLTVESSVTYYAVYASSSGLASVARFNLSIPTDANINEDNSLDDWNTDWSEIATSFGVTGITRGIATYDDSTNTLIVPWTLTGTMKKYDSPGTASNWKGVFGFANEYKWGFPVLLSTGDTTLTSGMIKSVKAGKVTEGTNTVSGGEMNLNLHWALSGKQSFDGLKAEACHVGAMKVNTVESAYFTITYSNGFKEKHVVTLKDHYAN